MIFLACVLRLAVTEGPVLLLHLDKTDDHIFAPQSQTLMQAVGDGLVKGALHIESPPLVHGHLDDDCVLGTRDSQVSRIDDQATGLTGWLSNAYLVPTPGPLHPLRGDDASNSTLALSGLPLRGGEPRR